MFYTRYLFKLKRPEFEPPGKIDEDFYLDIRNRLINDPRFTFQSDFNFWYYYKYIFIVFILFIFSILFLLLSYFLDAKFSVYLMVIPYLFFLLGIQPSVYFIIAMIYYVRYLMKERQYQQVFKKAIAGSSSFENFSETFYTGVYSEPLTVQEYLFENEIIELKGFVEDKGLVSHIAVYRFNVPPAFVVLSSNEEINRFIESGNGFTKLKKSDKLRWTIKYQTGIPCIYGNKGLKKLMKFN
ncbi:MAG TPA: hypothetical protein VK772_17810 [Puia sp.]|jgi:hypothetical protein|nr:hypothetical protein [Puia sp.]